MGVLDRPLPEPYSEELVDALSRRGYDDEVHAHIYAVLYRARDEPPTNVEITEAVEELIGRRFSQIQRRRRELSELFLIERVRGFRYLLSGWRTEDLAGSAAINKRIRYLVVQAARCAKCGRTVAEDGIKLEIDHIIPQAWGGTDDRSNLQALCEDCNAGKKDLYSSFDAYADAIRAASRESGPHRRIAALHAVVEGAWLPSDLIGAVASAQQYQEDWQKRQRELRVLNWTIEHRNERSATGRVTSFYRAAARPPLPDGDIAAEIRRRERARKLESQLNVEPVRSEQEL